jgi:hypothetical protein
MNFSEFFQKIDLEKITIFFAAILFFPLVLGFMFIKVISGTAEGLSQGYELGAKKRMIKKSLAEGRRPPVGF